MFKDKKLLSILGLSFISFFSTIWIRKADLMESRNFITAREIVTNNEWFVTTLNGQYRFEKPPLPTWLTAIIMKLTNNFSDEWLLRIPVALASVLLIYFIYKFVQHISKNDNLAFLSSFVATTTFMLTKVGSENAWDAYPYIFMFGSITYLVKSLNSKKNIHTILGGLFLAASLLSKGPVALYGMLLPFIVAYIVIYGLEEIKTNKVRIGMYFLIGLALASIWPVAMMLKNKELFLSVMNKEKDTWSSKHVKGFFFYANYFIFMGSWIFFSVAAIFRKWNLKDKGEHKLFKFGILWTILTFILLSLVKMKKERYGFPMYIVSSIPLGIILNYYLNNNWNTLKKFDRVLFYVQSVFISIVCVGSIGIILWKRPAYYYLIVPFIALMIYMFRKSKIDKDIFKKKIVYLSGFLLVLVNCNLTWIIERDIRGKGSERLKPLETLQTVKKGYKIYSKDFGIQDVWSVGQLIHTLDENTTLPEAFYILSSSSNLDLKNDYKIQSKETYSRFKDDKDLIYLYKVTNEDE
ncbi:ArnT family glycosyltransferase [Candidatus Cetobacterium colombiensis]|uniref:Glycosyltransferase family 39 protein n=1 Tax=Candidatus Cetobacterium colombiensis TaxID=3073100 RepID=A0ABU4WBD6_9FUSO|nr:glycosyltransferase family 39 protein [Candidatus Cetobacterium colombiensis]MDX8336855.1 glycosyltransferase family 39 protein [Candidatus Cetobacterium colombiensis]